jgi:hypothetical protein
LHPHIKLTTDAQLIFCVIIESRIFASQILDYSSTLIATAISPSYQPKQLIVFFSPRLH